MFIDTHCHLNMIVKKGFDTPLTQNHFLMIEHILKQARKEGVEKIITIGTSIIESQNSIFIAKRFEKVFAVVGLHPCDCTTDWQKDFLEIEKLVKKKESNKIVGIGETGLDFFHKPFNKQRQIDAFKAHIELALQNDLSIVVHVRESGQEVLQILDEYKNEIKGVIHCFMHKKDFANIVLQWGFYVGLNAPITYPKNQWFCDFIPDIPLDKILLETDSPFLPPQQFRGKQNLPSYIPIFAKVIADLKGIELSGLEKVTTLNAEKLFGI